MEFDSHPAGAGLTVTLKGRMEFTDHEHLRTLVRLMDNLPSASVYAIDAGGLDFIDSAGLGMLLILEEEAEQRGLKLVIRGIHGGVRRSIELARIDDIITIEPSPDAP